MVYAVVRCLGNVCSETFLLCLGGRSSGGGYGDGYNNGFGDGGRYSVKLTCKTFWEVI